jgi:arylsulfatase A-like enzyme/Tfp pilus assembly protein PilF
VSLIRRRAAIGAGLLLIAAALSIGFWMLRRRAAPRIEARACTGCNVLLITIDTLRGDRLRAFGGGGGVAPNLDRLADEGLRLTRTYASAPLTLPSHASILTAVSPPVHGIRANGLYRLGPDRPTLATILKSAGYRTGAFVGAFVLDARFGLGRGFDVYDDRYGEKRPGDTSEGAERRAEEVIKPALAWILGEHPAPFFAWIHLYDPHEPYRAPEPYASRYSPYDAEVAYVDAQVGGLLDRLRTAGALDKTLVAVVADHGESLGEHGERTHGVFVYDVTMRVPWILWSGSRLHGESGALVRLIDVTPTLLDLVGVPRPGPFGGASIVSRVHGREQSPPAYVEAMDANLTRNWAPLTGIVSDRFKFVSLPIPELYDLAADPREASNLYSTQAERARTLDALLRNTSAAFGASASSPSTITLSDESRQRLQALGYVGSSAGPGRRVYTDADDPKRLIEPAEDLNRALADFRRGSTGPAMAAVRAIIDRHPAFTTAYGVLASMQHDAGDLPAAIATLEAVVRREIADPSVMVVLAGYLQESGAAAQSAALLEAVVASHPDYADAFNSLGVAYSRMGRHDRARAAFRRVLELDPTSAAAYENLGVDDIATGDLDAAVADLSRALDLDGDLVGAHNALAVASLRRHEDEKAIEHWKRAAALNPQAFDVLYNLGMTLMRMGRRDEAAPYLQRFVEQAPPYRYKADIDRVRGLLTK